MELSRIANRQRITAALFALFLGGIGVHKFYLGKIGAGVAYLLFCWTFVPAVIAFIEALVLFSMDEREFEHTYNYR